ncbi:T7SS effector LXG polymorphic toxin [Bacillus changyiensis]|uniref:T7SS effector LXG polymorphic toxin n=1 Tax=Bacillus changyiensis TaxID=3004103 RepID=UPI0022DEB240|nr:T7SS effector LXG polymorphic toxin [Bacillus changyiensis]MDA1477254.1 T7SS effector LXG polymorphic toxin [Bacillus changyiensis]
MSSNKVFEANSLIDAADKRKKQYENFEEQLQTLKDAFLRMTKLDDFQGKAATNMKNFFSGQAEIVDSWLLLAKERIVFFETISYAVKNKKLEDLYVELSFLSQELENADKTADQVVSSLKSEMDGIIDSVRDIIHLDKWTEKNYHENMSKAQKTRTDTIDAVNELDHSLTTDYQKTKSMEDVVQEKYKGLIDATSNGKSTEPMNFSLKRFHASKVYQTSKALENYATAYIQSKEYQLEVEKEKERIEKERERIRELQIKLKSVSDDDEFLEVATEIGYDNLTTEQQERFTEIKEDKEFWDHPFLGTLNKTGDMIGQGVQNTVEAGKNFAAGSKAVLGSVGEEIKNASISSYEFGKKVGQDTVELGKKAYDSSTSFFANIEEKIEKVKVASLVNSIIYAYRGKKELDKIGKQVDEAGEKHLGTVYRAGKGVVGAAYDFVKDVGQSAFDLGWHIGEFSSYLYHSSGPEQVLRDTWSVAQKAPGYIQSVSEEIRNTWDKKMVHGNAYTRAHYVTYLAAIVYTWESSATRVGKAGSLGGKASKLEKGANISKKATSKIKKAKKPLVPKMQLEGIPLYVFSIKGLEDKAIQFIKKVKDAYNGAKGGKAHGGHGIKKTPKGGHGGEPKVPHKQKPKSHESIHKVEKNKEATKSTGKVTEKPEGKKVQKGKHGDGDPKTPHQPKSKPHEPVHKVDKPHESNKDAGTVSGKHPHESSKPKKHEPTKKVDPSDSSPLAPGGGLLAHEAKGGHLIERHVGKTDEELLKRLKEDPRIFGSSTFKDRAAAEKVAHDVLIKNKNEIQKWLNNSNINKPLILPYKGTEVLGRGVAKGSHNVINMTNAKIVLKKNSGGSFILTGYPTR